MKLKNLYTRLFPMRNMKKQLKAEYSQSLARCEMLGPYATAILTETYNGKILVPVSDLVVGKELAFTGKYNQDIIEYHLTHLSKQAKVLIIGAHVGSLLLPIAKKVNKVIGIEANPETFKLLKMNVLLNELHNVELYNWAAGDQNQTVQFLMNVHNTGGSKIMMGKATDLQSIYHYDAPTIATVEMKKLDDALAEHNFELVIIDIEGAEYRALKGMPDILAHTQKLQIEMHWMSMSEIAQIPPEQWAKELSQYFSQAVVPGKNHKIYHSSEFQTLLQNIYYSKQSADIIFQK